nr:AAA family ATPase [Ferrimicrobium acidiphilum]
MQKVTFDLANLLWQLELLIKLDPSITDSIFENEWDFPVATDPNGQTVEILEHFIKTDFDGFRAFLRAVESGFKKNGSTPGVVGEIFKSWGVLVSQSSSGPYRILGVQKTKDLIHEGKNAKGINSQRREGFMRLLDPHSLIGFEQRGIANPDRDLCHKTTIANLVKTGPYRKYTFEQDVLEKLSELRSTVPNFTNVTDRVIDAVNLAMRYHKPIQITPILLAGEPGIGKSHYTAELSKCLGVPLARVAIDNLQVGAALAGSSYIYSNSESGEVFKVLSEQCHISPLVVLDEIDKAQASSHEGDPLSPLHNLLEPVSAREFRDASVPIPIDASHVIWVATANYLERIPSAIKSRFEIFEAGEQSEETKKLILRSICKELQMEYAGIEFSEEVLGILVDKTPREQHQLLQRALARTVRLDETVVALEHLIAVFPGIKLPEVVKVKRCLGYL